MLGFILGYITGTILTVITIAVLAAGKDDYEPKH